MECDIKKKFWYREKPMESPGVMKGILSMKISGPASLTRVVYTAIQKAMKDYED